jgi:hypothetical protein
VHGDESYEMENFAAGDKVLRTKGEDEIARCEIADRL